MTARRRAANGMSQGICLKTLYFQSIYCVWARSPKALGITSMRAVGAILVTLAASASAGVPTFTVTALGPFTYEPQGINDNGVVTGVTQPRDFSYNSFAWQNGVRTVLSTLNGGDADATAINN